MSANEPIRVELSPFEKLQILRDQEEDRKKELTEVEVQIREKLAQIETQRYLETLSPYYASNRAADLPSAEDIQTLEQRRTQLGDLLKTIETMIPEVMKAAEGKAPAATAQPGASQPAGPARRAKFDSFDDFKQQQG